MKRRALWKVSIIASPQAEEAVTELLLRTFGGQAASYTDIDSGTTTVSVFSQNKPDWSHTRRTGIRKQLNQLKLFGFDIRPARLSLAKLAHENWAESWKCH